MRDTLPQSTIASSPHAYSIASRTSGPAARHGAEPIGTDDHADLGLATG